MYLCTVVVLVIFRWNKLIEIIILISFSECIKTDLKLLTTISSCSLQLAAVSPNTMRKTCVTSYITGMCLHAKY